MHTFWISFIGRTNNRHITISLGERIVEYPFKFYRNNYFKKYSFCCCLGSNESIHTRLKYIITSEHRWVYRKLSSSNQITINLLKQLLHNDTQGEKNCMKRSPVNVKQGPVNIKKNPKENFLKKCTFC